MLDEHEHITYNEKALYVFVAPRQNFLYQHVMEVIVFLRL